MALPFVGPSYQLALRKASVQRSVNLYLVGMETPSKAPFVLDSVPGLSVFAACGAPVRGATMVGARGFVAVGSTLFEFDTLGTLTNRGALDTATGVVDFAYGLTQLVMVDGANGYVLTTSSNAFAKITSTAFYGSTRVWFLDNYFLFLRPDTQQFYISAINDATTLDALDFASAESQPDNLVAMVVSHSEVWLFGALTTEVWFNSGNADFPFERSRGAVLDVGCAAVHSAQVVDNSVFWLGRDLNGEGMVFRADGYKPQRISTQAVEQALQASTDLSSARAYCYQEFGLTFYAINAPGLTTTWCYEVSTGQWHERADIDQAGQFKAHRATCHVYAFGKHLLGADDGNLYLLDRAAYTNNGDPLVCERTSPNDIQPGLVTQFFPEFFADVTTGEAPQGVDPQWELSWSGDAGATWSNPRIRSAGQVGDRKPRLLWSLLGGGKPEDRDRVWRLRCSSNAPKAIINAGARAIPGTS